MPLAMKDRRKFRNLLSIFKDKASLVKAILSTKRKTSKIRTAVVRATTHSPTKTPSETRISTVLFIGNGSRSSASACIEALMDRLHATSNAFVALKCLFTIHHVIAHGSFILVDQLSCYPFYGGRNFLNLSTFRDYSDTTSFELSAWVRWYAVVLEQTLIVSRVLGYYFCSCSCNLNKNKPEKISGLLNSDLLTEIESLAGFVHQIGESAPESLHLQRNDLVYDVVRLVGEDYRFAQSEMLVRVTELDERIGELGLDGLTQFLSVLTRIEDCRKKLLGLFGNRKRNDGFWELINQTKIRVLVMVGKRKEGMMVVATGRREESTRLWAWERIRESTRLFRVSMNPVTLAISM